MKKLIAIIALLVICFSNAQGKWDRFTASIYHEPFADKNTHTESIDHAFNLGARIEYQMRDIYFQAESFFFPELNNVDYFDLGGGVGYNYRDRFDKWRLYTGVKLGFIHRMGWAHAKAGWEVGYEYYFKTFYIGFQSGRSWREDGRAFSSLDKYKEGYLTWDNGVRIGIWW